MNLIIRLCWFLAGAHYFILKQCPSDHNRFTKVGLSILLTGIVASFTGGYAVYASLDENISLSIIIGIIWGIVIINIDSQIVSTIKNNLTIWEKFKVASLRIALSTIIGIVIAHPFEIRLFEKEIKNVLVDKKMDECLMRKDRQNSGLRKQKKEYESQLSVFETDKKNKEMKCACLQSVAQAEGAGKDCEITCDNVIYRTSGKFGTGLSTSKTLYNRIITDIDTLRREVDLIEKKMNEKRLKIDSIEMKINIENCKTVDIKREIEHKSLSILEGHQGLLFLMWPDVSSFSKLESEGVRSGQSDSTLIQQQITYQLNKIPNDKYSAKWMVIFITALIIFIEISPVILKVIQSPGYYEKLSQEYELEDSSMNFYKLLNKYPFFPDQEAYITALENSLSLKQRFYEAEMANAVNQVEVQNKEEVEINRLNNIRSRNIEADNMLDARIRSKNLLIIKAIVEKWTTKILENLQQRTIGGDNLFEKKFVDIIEKLELQKEQTPPKKKKKPQKKSKISSTINNHLNMKKQLKVMILGHTQVGKSYYLASINHLRRGTDPNFFSLQSEDFTKMDMIGKIFTVITQTKEGAVPTTISLVNTSMIFKKSTNKLFKINFTDIEGQALEPERNVQVAKSIIKDIGECDAIILIVKAPANFEEKERAIDELAQMYLFAEELLAKKQNVPICLIINQVDLLDTAKGISTKIESDVNADSTTPGSIGKYAQTEMQRKTETGKSASKHLKHVFYSRDVLDVARYFERWILAMEHRYPSRIFFCTSLGFDNAQKNPFDEKTMIARAGAIRPFGTVASILWVIYAYLRCNEEIIKELGIEENIVDKLLEDIRILHTNGEAYFDDQDDLWSLRNINQLFPIHDRN